MIFDTLHKLQFQGRPFMLKNKSGILKKCIYLRAGFEMGESVIYFESEGKEYYKGEHDFFAAVNGNDLLKI